MDFDELKDRYKSIDLWIRLVVMAVLGLTPAAYIFYDEYDGLVAEIEEQTKAEQTARVKFEAARAKKQDLPAQEEKLAFLEDQLTKARKSLPNTYYMEDILQKVATLAREAGVEMRDFVPGEMVPNAKGLQFMELPVHTEIAGRFPQITQFFDRLAHLESSVFVRGVDLRFMEEKERRSSRPAESIRTLDASEQAQRARQSVMVKASFKLIMFRSKTDQELAEAAAAAAPAPAPAPGGAPHASNLDTQAAKVKGVAVKSQGSADAQSF